MTVTSLAARVFRFVPLAAFAIASHAVAPTAAAQAAEGSFERTLKVTGPVALSIRSGSGRIRVYAGADGTVRIAARLRADNAWFSGDVGSRIREIEKNPPVEQAGNSIEVGRFTDANLANHISIGYDVTVPAQTSVNARTGSGSIDIGDVGGTVDANTGSGSITIGRVAGAVVVGTGSGSITVTGAGSLKARTGSGSIRASAIAGAAAASSGSGSVHVAQSGSGDVDVSSSSGGVVVTGVNGAARVSASSGSIEVEGRPAGPWDIRSSSGGVTVRIPADAQFDLDARVSSGRIETTHPITMTGTIDKQRLQGKVRGGGPLVAVRTSSGGIRIR
jgi:Putative adhesin